MSDSSCERTGFDFSNIPAAEGECIACGRALLAVSGPRASRAGQLRISAGQSGGAGAIAGDGACRLGALPDGSRRRHGPKIGPLAFDCGRLCGPWRGRAASWSQPSTRRPRGR